MSVALPPFFHTRSTTHGTVSEGPNSEAPVRSAGVPRSVAARAVGVDERPKRDCAHIGYHIAVPDDPTRSSPMTLSDAANALIHRTATPPSASTPSTTGLHHQIRISLLDTVLHAAREGIACTEIVGDSVLPRTVRELRTSAPAPRALLHPMGCPHQAQPRRRRPPQPRRRAIVNAPTIIDLRCAPHSAQNSRFPPTRLSEPKSWRLQRPKLCGPRHSLAPSIARETIGTKGVRSRWTMRRCRPGWDRGRSHAPDGASSAAVGVRRSPWRVGLAGW